MLMARTVSGGSVVGQDVLDRDGSVREGCARSPRETPDGRAGAYSTDGKRSRGDLNTTRLQ